LRHPREPQGLVLLVCFLLSALAAGLSCLLALACRLPDRGPRYLGRMLYGASLLLQVALLLLDLIMMH
nr:hypothetical protein [Polyangiaceae bacterium]